MTTHGNSNLQRDCPTLASRYQRSRKSALHRWANHLHVHPGRVHHLRGRRISLPGSTRPGPAQLPSLAVVSRRWGSSHGTPPCSLPPPRSSPSSPLPRTQAPSITSLYPPCMPPLQCSPGKLHPPNFRSRVTPSGKSSWTALGHSFLLLLLNFSHQSARDWVLSRTFLLLRFPSCPLPCSP